MMQLSNNDIDRKLRLSKKFFCFGLVTFCIGFLMIGFAIGRLSYFSNAEADGFQTEVAAGGNVYVSDSPGSKRYHKDRNCPALKRSTGKITSIDEANAIDQGKTLCGWCGKK
nr:MAG TPA: Metal binding domain of Ada [Caudoviricetes sp.]